MLKIILHSHKWADFYNCAENYASFQQMGRFYVDSRNDVTLRFPDFTSRKFKNSWDTHTGAGNQFRVSAIASKNPSNVYALEDRNFPYYDQSDTVKFFVALHLAKPRLAILLDKTEILLERSERRQRHTPLGLQRVQLESFTLCVGGFVI